MAAWAHAALLLLACSGALLPRARAQAPAANIVVDFTKQQDLPLFKKYAVMNSGLIDSARYNDTILQGLGLIRAHAFVTDLYMGTSNPNASFGSAITGPLASAATGGIVYNWTELDRVTKGLGAAGVTPYWAVTYAPRPFQPGNITDTATQLAQCLGFQDQPGKYQCRPAEGTANSAAGFDDCWKCPPKDADGSGYSQYAAMLKELAAHEAGLNVTVYKQIWNEPDITSYFNYSAGGTTFFHGTNADYNEMYEEGATAMAEADPDLVVGGPGLAYWLQTNPAQFPDDQRVSGTYFAEKVSNSSLPLDFFSFHSIAACTDAAACDIANNGGQETFAYRSQVSRYALTDPPAGVDTNPASFNTTEIHCTEYYAGTTAEQYGLPYSASPALASLMLSNFLKFLDQTDVTQVTWAQYMDVTASDGIGLLDFYGNARPAWHAFRFWGDVPIERNSVNISDPAILAVSGFNSRACHGGLLLWSNSSQPFTVTANLSGIPFSTFSVQAYVLDANHLPGPGYSLDPYVVYSGQTAPGGRWSFPPPGEAPFVLLPNATVYLNISSTGCASVPPPDGRVLKTHHYFSKRPLQTYMYGQWDAPSWSAHIGMGNETQGTALAGANVLVNPATSFNVTMQFYNIPPPPATPALGMRVDFWDPATNSFPANASVQFYQTGTKPGAQMPRLYGSKQDVPADKFFYVDLQNFLFNPRDPGYGAPAAWNGKLSIVFALQDGGAFSAARAYITQQLPAGAQIASGSSQGVAANGAQTSG